jgi:hypothetical protein
MNNLILQLVFHPGSEAATELSIRVNDTPFVPFVPCTRLSTWNNHSVIYAFRTSVGIKSHPNLGTEKVTLAFLQLPSTILHDSGNTF